MNTVDNITDAQSIVERVKSIGLPAPDSSLGKVPIVTGLKVIGKTFYPDRVDVILSFIEPINPQNQPDHYLIYVSGSILQGKFVSPYSTQRSPATMTVPLSINSSGTLTFTVQTVLANGFVADLDKCPTTSVKVRTSAVNQPLVKEVSTITWGPPSVGAQEFTIDTFLIPARTLKVKSTYKFTFAFPINVADTAGVTAEFRFKLNGVLASASLLYNNTATTQVTVAKFEGYLVVLAEGASGRAAITAHLSAPTNSNNIFINLGSIAGGISTINTNSTNTIDITVNFSGPGTTNGWSITGSSCWHEIYQNLQI